MLKHVCNSFEFVVNSPMEKAFLLFGANGEKAWDLEWEPQFVYPSPARDVAGAVFRVQHGHHHAVWINTAFDAANGHIQYAYFLPDVMVTLIDIRLTPLDAGRRTQAIVVYERTALSAKGNAMVTQRGNTDSGMGSTWQTQINGYLQSRRP